MQKKIGTQLELGSRSLKNDRIGFFTYEIHRRNKIIKNFLKKACLKKKKSNWKFFMLKIQFENVSMNYSKIGKKFELGSRKST
jgi:hypothetical protein